MSPARKNETKNQIKGVLFDWDGTLLDSFHADSSAYLAMFHEMGVTWGLDQLAEHYSPNWYDVYRAAGLPEHHWNAADAAWRQHYSEFRPKVIPGARQVLTAVSRSRLQWGHQAQEATPRPVKLRSSMYRPGSRPLRLRR